MPGCDFLNQHEIPVFKTGIVRAAICVWYAVLAIFTVTWLNRQSKHAMRGDASATRAVIFPAFANIIVILALSDLYFAVTLLTVNLDPSGDNDVLPVALFSVGFLLQHLVAEGIAIMLMQKGCGVYAAQKAAKLALLWGVCTFGMVFVVYSDNEYSVYAFGFWNAFMILLYSCLWLLPTHILFRRPAVYIYSKIFLAYRIFSMLLLVFLYLLFDNDRESTRCTFFVTYLVLDSPVQFLGTYLALLEDSRWWQGIGNNNSVVASDNLSKSPLHGFDVSLISAQELAKTLDYMSGSATANLINFAHIYLDKKKLLGFGSFSKVYQGKYKLEPVAIKLIFTMDLTESDIQRAAAEATILSSISSKNIVNIYGVTVLPPSVCLVLELCVYGSLADILRGPKALALSTPDRMYLALGCCRGVAALHALNEHVVHRDIKSFNFLVDDQLNAKLADLELGFDDNDDVKSKADNEALFREDFLLNWLAPEVLQTSVYTQASDIYSLSLVLWEIMSGEYPFSNIDAGPSKQIREYIIKGKRPSFEDGGFPICCAAYENIATAGWSMDPTLRPTAASMVTTLDILWQTSGNSRLQVLEDSRKVSSLLRTYLDHDLTEKRKSGRSDHILSSDPLRHKDNILNSSVGDQAADESPMISPIEQSAPLRDLFNAIATDPVWKIARSSADPLMIVSGQAPHVVLLMSNKFESLTGLRQQNSFGLCFEDFVTAKNIVDKEGSNQKILSDFYVSLKLSKNAHIVLHFLTPSDEEVTMSIHANPVYPKNSVEYNRLTSGERRASVTLESLKSTDLDGFDFSDQNNNADQDPLYFILDMNHLVHIYDDEPDTQLFRTPSTHSLSARLNGLFRPRSSSINQKHVSMQNQNRSISFAHGNRSSNISNMMRTSYSSGNLAELKDSLVNRESLSSVDVNNL